MPSTKKTKRKSTKKQTGGKKKKVEEGGDGSYTRDEEKLIAGAKDVVNAVFGAQTRPRAEEPERVETSFREGRITVEGEVVAERVGSSLIWPSKYRPGAAMASLKRS